MHQDLWREHRAAIDQHVGGKVHLVVERSIELCRGCRPGGFPVHDVSGDHARAPKADADGFGSGGELALLGEVAYFLVDLFRHIVEPGIAFQHQSHVLVALEDAGDRTQRAGTHQVVIAHEEAKVAAGFFDETPDVCVVAEVCFVFVVAQRAGIALRVFACNRGDLLGVRVRRLHKSRFRSRCSPAHRRSPATPAGAAPGYTPGIQIENLGDVIWADINTSVSSWFLPLAQKAGAYP